MVRDKLWDKIQTASPDINAIMIFSSDSEQGFSLKMIGDPKRTVVDIEGIELIKIQ